MDWLNDDEKTTFIIWLYGPAGAGKSAILQTIAEMCTRLQILLASFFWSRNSHGQMY
jgi:adenylylsulfate kinase-like enzyme